MDISDDEKPSVHPTSQSKYIKQAKNATSKANAEKVALNAIREKIELERLREEQSENNNDETSRKERTDRTKTPAKSAATRKSQKSASNRNNSVSESVNSSDNDIQYGKPYVDVSNRQINAQYSSAFPDFRSGNLLDGNKQSSPEGKMDTNDNRKEEFDNDIDMDNSPSESKYIKRKHSSKNMSDNKQKLKSKSPEPIVLTPRDPPQTTRTNTYTVNMEAPNNQPVENNHKASDSPPERKKVGDFFAYAFF